MRWKLAKNGDSRIVEKFLIFPIEIKGEVRWLERAKIMQFYHDYYDKWLNDYFID